METKDYLMDGGGQLTLIMAQSQGILSRIIISKVISFISTGLWGHKQTSCANCEEHSFMDPK